MLSYKKINNFYYFEHWFELFFIQYCICSCLSAWEFHSFNWPHTLKTVPNALIYEKSFWDRSKRVINFRRDAGVITKWANSCFELTMTFGAILPILRLYQFQSCGETCIESIKAENGTNIDQRIEGCEIINCDSMRGQEISHIEHSMEWIRETALYILPIEIIFTSYKIQFWHIWILSSESPTLYGWS